MKILKLTGTIKLLSGLHIGGGDDTMKIGGVANGVVKDANSENPYIPGSSLKGKMRSLLEWNIGLVGIGNGNPFNSTLMESLPQDDALINRAKTLLTLFGDKEGEFGITRISVGDCFLNKDSKDMVLSEAKYENVINRQTGTAEHPRQTERVPAGVKFDFDIRIKVIEDNGDKEDEFIAMVKKGFELVELDYLGGNGSRGYGRVKFQLNE